MTGNPPPKRTATLDELTEALGNLSREDRLRLRRAGDQLAMGTEYAEGQELLNEAIRRALVASEGRVASGERGRAWPIDVDIVAFLMVTMRGLRSDSFKSLGLRVGRKMEALAGDDGDDNPELERSDKNSPSVDESLIERQERADRERRAEADATLIERHFVDDQEVLAIIEGEKEGWTAEQVRQTFGIEKTAYDTARKRLRRGVDKLMPGRSKK